MSIVSQIQDISTENLNLQVNLVHSEVIPENNDNEGTISISKLKRNKTDQKLLCQEGELWHRRMGHISSSYVQKLKNVATGLNDLICTNNINNCTTCAKSKLTRFSQKQIKVCRIEIFKNEGIFRFKHSCCTKNQYQKSVS